MTRARSRNVFRRLPLKHFWPESHRCPILAHLMFPAARNTDEIKSVQTDRRMLKLNNCVVLTEEAHAREDLVIDASYYVTSIRVQDIFRFC
jgi:hypothetical protein